MLIVKRVIAKGAYELVDYDGIPLAQTRNGLYLKWVVYVFHL